MRKIITFLLVIAAVVAGAVVFLILTTPRRTAGVRIPFSDRERALIAHVPQSADAFAIVPSAAAFESELTSNPVTRTALRSWRAAHRLPRGWMVGSADLVMWKSGGQIGYFLDLDPVRALLVRAIGIDVSGGAEGPRLDPAAIPEIDALASHLPPGDALVVQRDSSRGSYPPLSRPAVTSIRIARDEVVLTSVGAAVLGRSTAGETPAATPSPLPQSAAGAAVLGRSTAGETPAATPSPLPQSAAGAAVLGRSTAGETPAATPSPLPQSAAGAAVLGRSTAGETPAATPSPLPQSAAGVAVLGRSTAGEPPAATPSPFPRSAAMTAWFAQPPRLLGDLNRLFGAKVSSLVEDGGMISIYDVDTRRLLPRPIGVIAIPSDPARTLLVRNFAQGLGGLVHTGEANGMLLISFDDSIAAFERDGFDPAPRGAADWAVRMDPARMVPILKGLSQNVGLRIIAPRLFRSARDLDGWIGGLEQAKTIEGTDSVGGGTEVLRVRIVSK